MAANKVTTNEKPAGVEFAIGGLAGIGTGLLTNPADVLKTRLQLQGELAAPGTYRKAYSSAFNAAQTIARQEGLVALQSGLVPVLGLQIVVNGMRLGSYHLAKRLGLTLNDKGETHVLSTAALSGTVSSLAFIISSPLYLAKVKLQSHGAKHPGEYLNTRMIMKSLWREGGFRGLYRGWNANIPRILVGSSIQMTTFGLVTDKLKTLETFSGRPILTAFVASIVAGTCLTFITHPLDVMSTRIYNQGANSKEKGALYNGMFDAISKIVRTEGFLGLYKGVTPNWLRLAPYVVVCQVLYEKIAIIYDGLI